MVHSARNKLGLLVATVGICAAGAVFLPSVGGSSPATAGRIPESAFQGSRIDISRVPDYVSVADSEGNIVGYIPKRVLFVDERTNEPIAVFDVATRDTVVGYFYVRKGFIPVGTDPNLVPEQPITAYETGADGVTHKVDSPRTEPLTPVPPAR